MLSTLNKGDETFGGEMYQTPALGMNLGARFIISTYQCSEVKSIKRT